MYLLLAPRTILNLYLYHWKLVGIRIVYALCTDGHTDRHVTKPIVVVRNFTKITKKREYVVVLRV
jgi:hypothetical protein